jgi:hypothetical protein
VLDQSRLQLIGLSSQDAAEQIQFLLTGAPVTQVREDIRTVEVVARSAGTDRLSIAGMRGQNGGMKAHIPSSEDAHSVPARSKVSVLYYDTPSGPLWHRRGGICSAPAKSVDIIV